MEKNDECPCPEGQVRKDGKCVMPEVTFTAFVMSLNTSALFHLGEISDPATGEKQQDLVLVKHTIDTLQLLEDKTKGNLTDEERDFLKKAIDLGHGEPKIGDDWIDYKDYELDSLGLSFWVSYGIVENIAIFPKWDESGNIPIWPKIDNR